MSMALIPSPTTTMPARPVALAAAPPLSRNPAAVYLAGLGSPRSRRTMRQSLDSVARLLSGGQADAFQCPWERLTFAETQALRSALLERGLAPASINRLLAAVRGTLKAAWRLGLMTAEAYHRAGDVAAVRGERLPRGRALSQGELRALFEACRGDTTAAGRRDAAVVAVLYGAGLRRAELAALAIEDIMPGGEVRVLQAKGGKQRTAYLGEAAARAVAAWLEVRGAEPGPLFLQVNKGGRLLAQGISGQAVERLLTKRGREAGVADVQPHNFRRTFISDLLDAGADLVAVQALAGHSSPVITAKYDRRGERVKQKAAGLLHVPFTG